MNLVDRYVSEVSRRLPRSRRDDIARELKSTLLDAVESRFGPSANDDEAAAVLKEFGRPEAVAASYWPSSQYLIGPQWYPAFLQVLQIHLLVLGALVIAGVAIQLLSPNPGGAANIIGSAIQVMVFAFGVIVLIFHLLERGEVRARPQPEHWNPRDLPEVGHNELVGRAEALSALIASAAGMIVLVRFKDYIGIPSGDQLLLNDILQTNLPWIVAGTFLTILQWAVLLWQGRWHWYTRCSKIGVDIFGLLVMWKISSAVVAAQGSLTAAGISPQVVTLITQCANAVPFISLAVILFDNGKFLFKTRASKGSLFLSFTVWQ